MPFWPMAALMAALVQPRSGKTRPCFVHVRRSGEEARARRAVSVSRDARIGSMIELGVGFPGGAQLSGRYVVVPTDQASGPLLPGGIVCAYVATTTQLSKFVEAVYPPDAAEQEWQSRARA